MPAVPPITDLSSLQRALVQFTRRNQGGNPATLNTVQAPRIKAQIDASPTRTELVQTTVSIRAQVDPRGQIVDLTA